MDKSTENQESVPENLNNLLAVAVRSVQWSYAIFWSRSIKQQGVLEWKEGYYNGDIKTRKTVQATEIKADKIGLQRSELLRDLYKSLLRGETDEESRKSCASLSPEDLTDAEWYYLVCMSFVFDPGQGLPGRALACGETIWLCDAHQADTKIFSRSLLAKSASIETVVCFSHLGGVIELGVTEKVSEDHSLVQHVKASLLELSKPGCSEKSSSHSGNANDRKDPTCSKLNHQQSDKTENLESDPTVYNEQEETINEDFTTSSSSSSSDSTLSIYFKGESLNSHRMKVFQDSYTNLGTIDDLHYRKTVLTVLQNTQRLIQNSCLQSSGFKSSFLSWKNGGKADDGRKMLQGSILQKILNNVPLMYGGNFSVKSQEDAHRKNIENEKFRLLRSIIPSINKIDKESILDETIDYLKKLKSRIQVLEPCSDASESEARTVPGFPDLLEHISDNYRLVTRSSKKRKACETDETEACLKKAAVSENTPQFELRVDFNDEEVLIELTCVSREYILVDIIKAVNSLDLVTHTVQSRNLDGVLNLSLKSKVRGPGDACLRMIVQELEKVARKC